ncbi:uncharacterized protein LOC114742824 [Neltuma alba]|uniref:uncharacterized protein LOC114742824 n=1 Tax=Neltuma alba TaxID=207710 RepID=UPI0010A51201|nr:uncharacterized protein LOC114742824 [Prosopis alba]
MDSPTPSVRTPRRPSGSWSHGSHQIPSRPQDKLRLMCSYGGRIVPRPHDRSLCYVGGDTRIAVVHRHSSLTEVCLRLSRTLLHGRPFILKYLLPGEDFDGLISIIHDEDLQLMIQEYDRVTAASPLIKPLRLRLFLFRFEPEITAISIHDADQEFMDASHDYSGILSRLGSDASAVDCSAKPDGFPKNDSGTDLEALAVNHNNKQMKSLDDVNTVSDLLVADTSPSGSLSSSPSIFSLPPLGVDDSGGRPKQEKPEMEELFVQLNFATNVMTKQEDGCAAASSAALAPPVMVPSPLQLVHARTSDALSLLSPYPIASYLSKAVHLQEQVKAGHANMRSEISDTSPAIQMDQVEECAYRLGSQVDRNHQIEQFVHYVAIPSYYPVYAITVAPTHPDGVSSGQPRTVTAQSGPPSTVYINPTSSLYTASSPAILQPAQFRCPVQSNIAFASTSPGFEYDGTATFQKQTNTHLPPHYPSMTPPRSSDAFRHNIR